MSEGKTEFVTPRSSIDESGDGIVHDEEGRKPVSCNSLEYKRSSHNVSCNSYSVMESGTFVFDGKNFMQWRTCIVWLLECHGLKKFVSDKRESDAFIAASEEGRENTRFKVFVEGNAKLSPKVIGRIMDCKTAFEL